VTDEIPETPVEVFVRTKRVIVCPSCGKGDHGVDHLIQNVPYTFGPWYCDECGTGFLGTAYPDGRVTARIWKDRKVKTRVLLRLEPTDKPIHIEVDGMVFRGGDNDDGPEHDAEKSTYFYEEHTCVTNFLHDAVETWLGQEADPHGIFKFVAERPAPEDWKERAFSAEDLPRVAPPEERS
jgi:hypothetical protein